MNVKYEEFILVDHPTIHIALFLKIRIVMQLVEDPQFIHTKAGFTAGAHGFRYL